MESKNSSYDTEDEKALENFRVEDTFDNEDQSDKKQSEQGSHNKPSIHIEDQEESSETIWSEDEEIAILNIAIKFSCQKGLDPATHKTGFFVFIKESNQFDGEFSKYDVATKLKDMKKKFKRNLVKGKTISSPHENKIFELCEKIWGANGLNISLLSTDEISIISEKHVGLGENIVKEAMEHIGETTRVEFVQQWKEIQALELEVAKKRAALVEYQIKVMLEANKSSKQ